MRHRISVSLATVKRIWLIAWVKCLILRWLKVNLDVSSLFLQNYKIFFCFSKIISICWYLVPSFPGTNNLIHVLERN